MKNRANYRAGVKQAFAVWFGAKYDESIYHILSAPKTSRPSPVYDELPVEDLSPEQLRRQHELGQAWINPCKPVDQDKDANDD